MGRHIISGSVECTDGVLAMKGVKLKSGKNLYSVSDENSASIQLSRKGMIKFVLKSRNTIKPPSSRMYGWSSCDERS